MRPEDWAERHDGLLSADAARAGGLSASQMKWRSRSGRYRAVRRGVVAIAGSPPTWMQAVRAVALSVGERAAISHGTSARVQGAPAPELEGIHVTGDLDHPLDLPGVVSHRSGTLEPGDVIVVRGIRCTSPLRTTIDLSGVLTLKALGELVDHFVRARRLDLEELRDRVSRTRPAPGRSVKALRSVLAARLPGYDPGESPLEARIARVIQRAGLPRPTQQHRVVIDGARYRIDFAWPERKLYLEGNGFGFHRLSSDLHRDAVRQNELVLSGWIPIEITWAMSDTVIDRTLRRFMPPFEGSRAHPAPQPSNGS